MRNIIEWTTFYSLFLIYGPVCFLRAVFVAISRCLLCLENLIIKFQYQLMAHSDMPE